MDRRAAWILGLVFGGLFLCLFAFMALAWVAVQSGRGGNVMARAGGDRVGVVEVTGVIGDDKTTLRELREFAEDGRIRAIVVRIDSPGGSVGPSQEIFEAMRRLQKKKHVLASMGSIAASGGFYIAMGGGEGLRQPRHADREHRRHLRVPQRHRAAEVGGRGHAHHHRREAQGCRQSRSAR